MNNLPKVPDEYLAQYDGIGDMWLSTSALSLLMMCGVAFEDRYIKRKPQTTNIRMAVGSATHKGREVNLKQKVGSDEDMDLEAVQDATRDAANKIFETTEFRAEKEFEGKSKETSRGIAIDKSVSFVSRDYEDFQVDIAPEAVEEALAVRYEGLDRIICGKVDLRTTGGTIVDLKTGKRAKGQAWCDTSQALSTYGMLHLCTFGDSPERYIIHNIVDGKAGCKSVQYETTRTEGELKRQLRRFVRAAEVIEKGIFLPCNPEHWFCSEEWCSSWAECPFRSGQ